MKFVSSLFSALKWRLQNIVRKARLFLALRMRAIPLATAEQRESLTPFFIVCAGRSGSTLLRSRLMTSGKVNIPPESGDLIPKLIELSAAWNCRTWEDFVDLSLELLSEIPDLRFWKFSIDELRVELFSLREAERSVAALVDLTYRSQAVDKSIPWGDKTPYLNYRLDDIRKLFPSAKYIFLLRDGRDVVASMLKVDFGEYTLEKAAVRWRDSIRLMQRGLRHISPSRGMIVKYEKLVEEPEQVISKVHNFLNISGVDQLLSDAMPEMGDTVLAHHQNIFKPIDTESVGRWESVFGDSERRKLDKLLGPELKIYHEFD